MTQEQFLLFTAYINNELTQQQDAELMELLSSNPELIEEFEMEVMLRRGINKKEIVADFSPDALAGYESADAHIDLITKAVQQKSDNNKEQRVVSFSKKYRPLMAAAAVILIAVFAWLFFSRVTLNNIARNNKIQQPDTTQIKNDPDFIVPNTQEKNNNSIAANVDGQQLYAQNYTPYKGSIDDPVELSIYLSYYRQKEYDKVIAITKEDYQIRGANDTAIALYAEFYKALSYLETKKITEGKNILEKIVSSKETPQQLLYNAEWYQALAALQQNEMAAAHEMLKKIQLQKTSPWQKNAGELINALSNKK